MAGRIGQRSLKHFNLTFDVITPKMTQKSMFESPVIPLGEEKNMKNLQKLSLQSKCIAILLLIVCSTVSAQTKQENVHQMAHSVMPFDISRVTHIFKMTESGGVQQVIAKDPGATDQIELIRQHLRHEAMKFQQGDYTDPATLHGADMPGLKELQAGSSHIKVTYAPLPNGAEITFETNDLHLLTAVHRWFGAQLSEHCADAKAE
jgi:hypothetical protein